MRSSDESVASLARVSRRIHELARLGPRDSCSSCSAQASWKYLSVTLLERKEHRPGRYWIKVDLRVEIHGKTDGGTDEAGAALIGGKWYVSDVPT